ncbi:hypothetical protein [Pseudoduganella chitinolytica]|uniref:Uncharacterized protein n=1 Tax=Pseudoduganella chitinolytica TaxID=34070 RepID=A0ABY8BB09_9BURK|nr:hypothetical protein [Pseudoduganella chitinolytica]WEF33102.1 hypothetical protein PX653_27550 [Pseudoduganella chitinolytica]
MTELPKTIDELEDAVEDIRVLHEDVIFTLREFLYKLQNEQRFPNISKSESDPLLKYLNVDVLLSARKTDDLRSKLNLELTELAYEHKKNDKYYSLIRCIRLLYVDEIEWDRVAQDTLLFSFFFHLKHILTDIEIEFVKYFSDAFFKANES